MKLTAAGTLQRGAAVVHSSAVVSPVNSQVLLKHPAGRKCDRKWMKTYLKGKCDCAAICGQRKEMQQRCSHCTHITAGGMNVHVAA